ncbi:hypothetical protein JXD20_01860 [Candidatus Peregrinibacteria bacterium]|nr:hypothetical protein [Candidatus Peregrinibacteria bacterium]
MNSEREEERESIAPAFEVERNIREAARNRLKGRALLGEAIRGIVREKVKQLASGIEAVTPVGRYEQEVGKVVANRDEIGAILLLSDALARTELSNLVNRFNADLNRIKKENDRQAVISFSSRLLTLLGGND